MGLYFDVALIGLLRDQLLRMFLRGGVVGKCLGVGLPAGAVAAIADHDVRAGEFDLPELVAALGDELEPPFGGRAWRRFRRSSACCFALGLADLP